MDFTKLKEEVDAESGFMSVADAGPDLDKIKNILSLLKQIAEIDRDVNDLSGKFKIKMADLTDFDNLTDLERDIKSTGDVIHSYAIINVPHIILITSKK